MKKITDSRIIKNRQKYIGKVFMSNQKLKYTIIDYINSSHVHIRFNDNNYEKIVDLKEALNGSIANPYAKRVYSIGYLGDSYNIDKDPIVLSKWSGMLHRCYNTNTSRRRSTYANCYVSSEWHHYTNFAKWYNENKWSDDCTHLDKDILYKHNKLYSPQTCILVDNRINCLFTKSNKLRGKYPIGVFYKKANKKFAAQCSMHGLSVKGGKQQKHLGLFSTPEEAFLAYKKFKENYIKQVADEYKEKYPNFPQKLYDAMYNYVVEITD